MQFLETLATALMRLSAEQLADATVLLPNRRSGQYLIKKLSQKTDKPIWLPQIYTLEDWVVHQSGLESGDGIYLNLKLHELYKKYLNKQEGFEDFYPYGEILLSAFDQADRNLVNLKDLCKIWKERTEIDLKFGDALTDEQKTFLQTFWLNIDAAKQSFQKEKFLEELAIMPQLYEEFKNSLLAESICYPGLAYKVATSKSIQAENQVFLAGCHLLEPSTLQILKPWQEAGLLECFWNFPEGFSMFTYEGWSQFKKLEKSGWIKDYLPKLNVENNKVEPAEVEIIGASLGLGQVQAAAELFKNWQNPESVCLILPDPALLPPLLHALPKSLPEFNVTMGFPLRLSMAYSWCNNLIESSMSIEQAAEANALDTSKLSACLKHPFLSGNQSAGLLISQLKEYVGLRIKLAELPNDVSSFILKPETMAWPEFLLHNLANILEEKESLPELEKNLLAVLIKRLESIESSLAALNMPWSAAGFHKIFLKMVGLVSAPFEGLPLMGLQIMGLLESQCLNFDHVVVLSANEDLFPQKIDAPGFFPLSLHKAFKMPMPEDQQNRMMEVFYSLMMRAKKVTLIYNQVVFDQQPAEPSRVIEQIRYEWPGKKTEYSVGLPFKLQRNSPIEVAKTPEIMKLVRAYSSDGKLPPNKTFSASSINTWLNCSLRFYFSKILKEEPIVDEREELGADKLGSLLHVAMENIYKLAFKTSENTIHVDKQLVKNAQTHVAESIRIAFKEVYGIDNLENLSGLLILAKTITEKYIHALLRADEALAPFDILGLEEENLAKTIKLLNSDLHVTVIGKIDRIDKKENVLRVADYKTGKAIAIADSMDAIFAWNRKDDLEKPLQGFIYAMLYESKLKPGEQMKVEFISLRNMFDQQQNGQDKGIVGIKGSQHTAIQELIPSFEAKLVESLESLFDADQPFTQTEDVTKCKYCSYTNICRRG